MAAALQLPLCAVRIGKLKTAPPSGVAEFPANWLCTFHAGFAVIHMPMVEWIGLTGGVN